MKLILPILSAFAWIGFATLVSPLTASAEPVAISPTSAEIAPGATQQFITTGGNTAGHHFTMWEGEKWCQKTCKKSCAECIGTIDGKTGLYTAPTNGQRKVVVRVFDHSGKHADATVKILPTMKPTKK